MNATLTPKKSRVGTAVLYAAFAVFYVWLAAQIPYSHDDWDWGLSIGLQHLFTADINSRYVGNFFIVIMSRSYVAKALIMGLSAFLIPLLLAQIAAKVTGRRTAQDRNLFFLAANLLLLTTNHGVLNQVYGWVSGFANYGISMVFMLLCLWELMSIFEPEAPTKASPWRAVLFGFVTLAGQLFLENVAIFMVLATICALIYHRKKHGSFNPVYIAMTLGALIGAAIMFSSSIYGKLINTGESVNGLRSFAFNYQDGIGGVIYKTGYQCLRLAMRLGEHSFAVLSILALLTIFAWNVKSKYRTLRLCVHGALAAYFLFALFVPAEGQILGLLGAFASIGFYICAGLDVLFLLREQKRLKAQLICVLVSGVCAILPLAITCEYGSRVVFPSNMFLLLFALILLGSVPALHTTAAMKKTFIGIGAVSAAVVLMFCWCYGQIGLCYTQRVQLIEAAIAQNADQVVLPAYPYQDALLHLPNPVEALEGDEDFFKGFYGIPEDMEIIFE